MTANVTDLIKMAGSSKANIARETGFTYVTIFNWCKEPAKFLNIGRSKLFDRLLKIPNGTTSDVILERHTIASLSELLTNEGAVK